MNYAPLQDTLPPTQGPTREALVLVNLGTPDAPQTDAIRRYLKQFLSDRRVVNLSKWLWLPLLHLFILRFRPRKLIWKYRMIWGTKDGPIRNITLALARRLQTRLNTSDKSLIVAAAMTYGNPSVSSVLNRLIVSGVERIVFIPLFPQFAGATIGAARDAINRAVARQERKPDITILNSYHARPAYIKALTCSIKKAASYRKGRPKIVFSFHNIPAAQAKAGDPYPEQCRETARLVAIELGLPDERWMVTWQSRFGLAKWLVPTTNDTMRMLPGMGVKDVLVVCPGFAVDCLETIEEIRLLNKETFLAAEGENFNYVKALNATQAHVDVMMDLLSATDQE